MARPIRFLISCEHGGNLVPEPYRRLFAGHEKVLQTHRGYDIGILPLARQLAAELGAPIETAEVTRLLVDLNRSPGNPGLFSEFSRRLPSEERDEIQRLYYHPYRQAVEDKAAGLMKGGNRVVHLSVHSFTPEFNGQLRNADIGLLYDPARLKEKDFSLRWQQTLNACVPRLKVRRNYPYRGVSDCLIKTLRRRLSSDDYLGIELEVNQSLTAGTPGVWQLVRANLVEALREVQG